MNKCLLKNKWFLVPHWVNGVRYGIQLGPVLLTRLSSHSCLTETGLNRSVRNYDGVMITDIYDTQEVGGALIGEDGLVVMPGAE